MSKEDVSITYENNIFYCTKNNTKWISVDGEKWYVEEKRIKELEKQIADIKANCDLAIEGRDIKIKELEKENERLTVSYETLKLHDEEEIGMLKSENAELKEKFKHRNCVDCSNHHSNIKLFKAKELLKRFIETSNPIYFEEDRQKVKVQAEQFLNEV